MKEATASVPREPRAAPRPRLAASRRVKVTRTLSEPVQRPPPSKLEKLAGLALIAIFLVFSLGGHVLTLAGAMAYGALHHTDAPKNNRIEVAVVEKKLPPPEPPKPKPPPPKKKIVRMDKPLMPPPKNQPPPPPDAPPPPPDMPPTPPPPTNVAPNPLAIPMVGITLSSTSSAGSFAMNVGNTAMGGFGRVAPAPAEVKPYKAEKFVPVYNIPDDKRPVFLDNVSDAEREKFYPPEAKRDVVEDSVETELTVDDDGTIVAVKILSWLHKNYAFDEATRKLAKLYRFKPGLENGKPVATVIHFKVNWELPY